MEPPALRCLASALCLFLFLQIQANPTFNAEEIKARFESMECIIKPRYTSISLSYIKGYLSDQDNGKGAKVMGRAVVYFPIFEKYLNEHNLPQDLKYLTIVESALLPKATSPVGAGGLWQFMRETGRSYGLRIDDDVDERSCAYRSTEAAMKYLARQYERFGNWEMALASYNCGASTINYAIKKARSEDYWKVSKYLPRETQNFVPAFLAAVYLANYYHLHEVKPQFPNLDMQLTESIKVYTHVDFKTIASVTGLPLDVVRELNPAFKNDFLPANPAGHYLVLPRRVMLAFNDYLQLLNPDNAPIGTAIELPLLNESSTYLPDELYFKSIYTVAEGDYIEDLASIFSCTVHNIRAWNELSSDHLSRGKELIIWFPNELLRFRPTHQRIAVMPLLPVATSPEVTPQPTIQPIEETIIAPSPATKNTVTPAEGKSGLEQSSVQESPAWMQRRPHISQPRFNVTDEPLFLPAELAQPEIHTISLLVTRQD